MDKRTGVVITVAIIGICFCLTQMVRCEIDRHKTYAPIWMKPESRIEYPKLKKLPIKEEK